MSREIFPGAGGPLPIRGRRRPTRRDLLLVVGQLQGIIGQLAGAFNDRNPDRADDIDRLAREGHAICVWARSFDPPLDPPLDGVRAAAGVNKAMRVIKGGKT